MGSPKRNFLEKSHTQGDLNVSISYTPEVWQLTPEM